jgi:hypothetical protein
MNKIQTAVLAPLFVLLTVAWSGAVRAVLIDVTTPGDPILIVNGVNDGDGNSGPPPAAEGVENAINNTGQKYLNFLDLGSGFIVTPTLGAAQGGTIVSGLRFYTANDVVPRDPASYLFEGADGSAGPWEVISAGDLALPGGRNPGGMTPIGSLLNFQEVLFANTEAYLSYRVTFPTLKDAAAANSMQIAEVELLGTVFQAPEPSTVGLVGIALVGLIFGAGRRRTSVAVKAARR